MKTYEPQCGETIDSAAKEMVAMATNSGETVTAAFNDIKLVADPGDPWSKVTERYHAESNARAEAYRKSPEGIAAAERQKEYQREYEKATAEGILPFTITDQETWDSCVEKNQDGYGSAVNMFAARWANIMERKILEGKSIPDMADESCHEADKYGTSGFQYGCAVNILSRVWEYGEDLRRWHNKEWGGTQGDAANESGGVINPAILTLETP